VKNKHYILVSPLKTIATSAQKYVTDKTSLSLTQHISTPSKSATLMELGMDPSIFDFHDPFVDAEACLHIPKTDAGNCQIVERSIIDIILYPFTKNVGLLMPLSIIEETPTELLIESHLVEPSARLDLFRIELEKSIS
jgi:hypothetical protein